MEVDHFKETYLVLSSEMNKCHLVTVSYLVQFTRTTGISGRIRTVGTALDNRSGWLRGGQLLRVLK